MKKFKSLIIIALLTSCNVESKEVKTKLITDAEMEKMHNPYYSRVDTSKLNVPDSIWKKILSPEVYHIAREKGTESRFTGPLWKTDRLGTYYCRPCGNPLFKSDAKFASTCGWPSFFEPIRRHSVIYLPDNSYGMERTEVQCGRCNAHLGHIFPDGPPPTGNRFCMNSIVLEFDPDLLIEGD